MTKELQNENESEYDYSRPLREIIRELESADISPSKERLNEIAKVLEKFYWRMEGGMRLREILALNDRGYAVKAYDIRTDLMPWHYYVSQYNAPYYSEITELLKTGEVVKINGYICIEIGKLLEKEKPLQYTVA